MTSCSLHLSQLVTKMAFYRTKRFHGRDYVYLVESYRDAEGGRRQRVLRYVGPVKPIYGGKDPINLDALRNGDTKRPG